MPLVLIPIPQEGKPLHSRLPESDCTCACDDASCTPTAFLCAHEFSIINEEILPDLGHRHPPSSIGSSTYRLTKRLRHWHGSSAHESIPTDLKQGEFGTRIGAEVRSVEVQAKWVIVRPKLCRSTEVRSW